MTSSEIRKNARMSLAGKWGKAILIIVIYALFSYLVGFISGLFGEGTALRAVVTILFAVISIPISVGLVFAFIKLKRGEEVGAFDFFKLGFSNFGKSWRLYLSMLLKMLLPIIVLIISIVLICAGVVVLIGSAGINALESMSNINASTAYVQNMSFGGSPVLLIVGIILYFASCIWLYIKGLSLALTFNIAYDEPELTGRQTAKKSQELMSGHKGGYFVLMLSFIGWAILSVLTLGIGFLWLLPYMQVSYICFYDALVGKTGSEPKVEEPVETPTAE